MINSEIVKQIETAPLAERIEIAEIILRSLRKDVKTGMGRIKSLRQIKIRNTASGKKISIERDGVYSEKIAQKSPSDDPWDNLNMDEISVDTGIEDFAENHDHYLYGTPKQR